MGRIYRYKLPVWLRQWLYIIEKATLPILIFQIVRTLFFPSSFDVFLLGILVGLFIAFQFEWL
ncbi:membrane protein [Pontibacillus halophilus JSM 076056 = DSM 19796]|uniref:Membrane protein n=1 Tax=Pontibacillus halophilus JSM 076056 = DSM 19796 TaxID=1385510 RepID=A0A0A5GQF7_9BACI|nr:hypothetical protein [Pontibacillus halophilus]KGX93468.1 membrane protein [Pontibacillus halophilus JSM 076056 = DSM 19796]